MISAWAARCLEHTASEWGDEVEIADEGEDARPSKPALMVSLPMIFGLVRIGCGDEPTQSRSMDSGPEPLILSKQGWGVPL